jgi:multiple sugar transport system substrate-binding protein
MGLFSKRFLIGLATLCLLSCRSELPKDTSIELTFWHGANPPPNRIVLEKLVDQFNKIHPKIRVRAIYAGEQDQQIPKILAAVIGGSPPDLLWYNATLTGQLVKNDALFPLDPLLLKEPILDQVYPSLRTATHYRGQTWSLPFDTNNLGIFYNRRIFREAGIKTMPRTWPAFLALARQLTVDRNGDGRPEQFGFRLPLGKGEWTVFNWLAFYWGAGGQLLDNGQPQFDSPAGKKALAYWRDFLATPKGASLSQPEKGYDFTDFFAGRVAMLVSGSWTLGDLTENHMDYGTFALPVGDVPATSVGGEQLFLLKTTPERQQASWEFAKYILSAEFQTAWATKTGYLPVTLEATKSRTYQQFLLKNPQLKVFVDQLPYGHNRPLDPTYAQLSDTLGQAIEQVLQGASTPEQALAAAQKEALLIVRTQPGDFKR